MNGLQKHARFAQQRRLYFWTQRWEGQSIAEAGDDPAVGPTRGQFASPTLTAIQDRLSRERSALEDDEPVD